MVEHLNILDQQEIEQLYGLPHFDSEQRDQYFYLEPSEQKQMESYRSVATRVYFILQLGYIKAKQQLFVVDFDQASSDVHYVLRRYFRKTKMISQTRISKPTRLAQQRVILNLFGFQPSTPRIRNLLVQKTSQLTRVHCDPIYIFRELVHYLQQQRIILPGYSIM